jgi:hypothetical protein
VTGQARGGAASPRSLFAAAAVLAGCAIPEPEAPTDPVPAGAVVLEGQLVAATPMETAFCVSQAVRGSIVVPLLSGAAVRPAPAGASPDYALVLWQADGEVTWRLQAEDPRAAELLRGALGTCAGDLGRTA